MIYFPWRRLNTVDVRFCLSAKTLFPLCVLMHIKEYLVFKLLKQTDFNDSRLAVVTSENTVIKTTCRSNTNSRSEVYDWPKKD